MEPILEINHLSVNFHTERGAVHAVRDVSLSVRPGETLAIVGESGCGKSALCRAIIKLLPPNAQSSGEICIAGTEISGFGEREMQSVRGNVCAMIFQDPLKTLNPTMTIGAQIGEAVLLNCPKLTREALKARIVELLALVGIPEGEIRMQQYPHELSGGMRQRVVLSIALAGEPGLLLADEPTTALDVTIQAQILKLLRKVQKELGMAIVFVSHDMSVVAQIADRIAVMYAGKVVEIGTAEEIFRDPRHPYTWGLLQSLPQFSRGKDSLYTIPGMPPSLVHLPRGDAFACRNVYALDIDYEQEPPMFPVSDTHFAATWLLDARAPKIAFDAAADRTQNSIEGAALEKKDSGSSKILLDVRNLTCKYKMNSVQTLTAVDNVSFQIREGEIFGLVGESGSGKSTIARCIMGLRTPEEGDIFLQTEELASICDRRLRGRTRRQQSLPRQIIFQDSASSLNPKMKVQDIVTEPFRVNHIVPKRGSLRAEAAFQLKYVGLDESCLDKYPGALSGGQRQRVAIARAVATEPKLLVADEPIASLDCSIQAQIVNLFRHLQREHGFSFLFIAHDLAMVEFLCDRVGVMHQGKLVEVAPTRELFDHPKHPYTKRLLAARTTVECMDDCSCTNAER